jgi:hypothetical protein
MTPQTCSTCKHSQPHDRFPEDKALACTVTGRHRSVAPNERCLYSGSKWEPAAEALP